METNIDDRPRLKERIEQAKEEADRARDKAGLGPVDDGPFTAEALKKRRTRKVSAKKG